MPRVRRSPCSSSDGLVFFAPIVAGTYTVAVGGWTAGQSASISYQLTIDLVGQQDNAPPLVDGPAPLLQIHLDGIGAITGTSTGTSGSGSGSRHRPGGSSLLSSVSLPGLANLNSAPNEAIGSLSSLGMSPLGGEEEKLARCRPRRSRSP